MKARGLFITGLIMTGLFAALHIGFLDSFILELPGVLPAMIMELTVNTDWQFGMLVMTLVGLFSLTFKKKEELF
jgi:hypothetical protein